MPTAPAPIRPGRLRRRLTIAFVLVGGLSAGALALGSYFVVRHARLDDSQSRALEQSRLNRSSRRSRCAAARGTSRGS